MLALSNPVSLIISFCITYKSTVKYEIEQSQINQNFGTVCHTEVSTLHFQGEEPNFQEQLQNFEVAASKFNMDRHLTSTTSKGLSENF